VLHPGKTRIVPFEQAFDFLGHLFVRSVVVAQERDEPCPPSRLPNALGPRSLSSPAMRDDGPAAEEEALAAAVLGQADLPDASALADDPLADLARDRDAGDFAAGLAPLYLVEPGRRLGVAHDCFTVSGGEGEAAQELLRIPAPLVGRIDIGPDARAGDEALRMAAVHGVPVSFVNGLGAAQAVLLPANSDMGGLHLAQASLTLDPARALAQAQILVTAKIANGRALLKRLNRRRKKEAVEAACAALKQVGRRAAVSMTLDKLRGMEGEAARLYWPALGACLEHGFALKRRRDDPANPVTAVLDFTAHLLTRDMVAAVLRSGLHPGFGVLHMSGDRREPAAWDLIEAFRAPLSEGLAVYLFNNRILQAADFVARAGGADKPGNGLRLTGAGSRALIEGYEGWMARPVRNRRTGNDTTWRGLLLSECRAFASALRSGAAFAPYRLDY
jgi:CRISPR-associated protein Cas1